MRLVGSAPLTLSAAAVGVALIATVLGSASQRPATPDVAAKELREIGTKLVAAVLNHDAETLLAYDRPDLRDEDRASLQDRKSQLSCFLFDHTCNAVGRPAIYDILSGAKRLSVHVRLLSAKGQPPHGWILFFDATTIASSRLQSASYLCQRSNEIASWLFKRENNRWVGANPIFDSETDTICSAR